MRKILNGFIVKANSLSKNGKLIVGLTGTIGSGKTTALSFFSEFGALVISSDEIVKDILTQKRYCSIILKRYPQVADSSDKIDRKHLASLIFKDKEAKRFVERIIHPIVISKIEGIITSASNRVIVIEIPLLFEVGIEKAFDLIVCIVSKKKDIINRLRARGMSYDQIKARIKSQLKQELKMEYSDVVVFNNTLSDFKTNIKHLYSAFKKLVEWKN